ncbi:MAG: hypothetical protein HUK10_12805 [Bacteroides heparinolyticus]|nr:hypothetical protein [Bacteroides heparinolyticus]
MEQIKVTINITKEVKNNIISEIDRRRYAGLDISQTDRFDLFNMALAIGLQEGKPTPLSAHESLVRTERLTEDILGRYRAIYYDRILAPDLRPIDEIVNTNAVLELIEQFANTGFIKLKEYMEQLDEDSFMYKLLADANTLYHQHFQMDGGVAENEIEYL